MWPGPQIDDGPRGVARHGVLCHNFNPAMHVVAENILVSLLTSARGRVVRAHGQLASCKCASMMSTDYQAMVAGQAGNWGVAVRMRMPPAARGPRKPRSLRGRGEPHLRRRRLKKDRLAIMLPRCCSYSKSGVTLVALVT